MSPVPCDSTVRVFYSRFTSGFTPDSRYNSISLNHGVGNRKRSIDRGRTLSFTLYHYPSHSPLVVLVS
jgi:hypothetical protein